MIENMKKYKYMTKGTCSRMINFEIDGNTVHNISFVQGCNGNGKGVGALAEGMEIDKVIKLLSNIDCMGRGTSCPAQLANALKKVKNGELKEEN